MKWVLIVLAVILLVGVILVLPDVRRYLRLRNM